MSAPTSPVKRVSSRTPKLSAKMIALEEEVSLKRRKTLEAAKSAPPVTAAAGGTVITTTGHNQQQLPTASTAAISETDSTIAVVAVASGIKNNSTSATTTGQPIYSTPAAPSKQKAKGGTCSSSQSNSARNRKRKSGSSSVKSAGNSPRKNSKNSSANLVPPNVGTSPQHVPILPATLDLPSEKEAPNQTAQQVALIRGAMGTTGRGAVSAKSVGSTQPVDRCAPSCSSGSGGMYEESELDVTQFTTDGGGGGCSSSQQLLLVDDTSESTISMMSLGVTSGSSGLPAAPVNRAGGGGKESKKKKSGTGGKKLQENNASEDEAEEKWLMAIEAGKLEEDAELRSMKDPALMTARQRAVVEAKQARVEYLQHIQALHEAWKDQAAAEQLSSEVLEKRAQKAAKRRQLAEEKRDKEKKDTIKRLLKKADSRQKTKKLQRSKAQMVAKVCYRYTYEGMTVSFPVETPPASLGIDVTSKRAQYPTPVLCSNVGCANLKKYQCSSNGLPVCSLQCYRQVSLVPPLAQLLESAAAGSQAGTPTADGPTKPAASHAYSKGDTAATTVAPTETV